MWYWNLDLNLKDLFKLLIKYPFAINFLNVKYHFNFEGQYYFINMCVYVYE